MFFYGRCNIHVTIYLKIKKKKDYDTMNLKILKTNKLLFALLMMVAACTAPATETGQADPPAETEQPLYVRMADSDMQRNPDPRYLDFRDKPKWEYTNGLMLTALLKVYERTRDEKYLNYARFYADSMIVGDGSIVTYKKSDYNIDRVNPGKFLMELYKTDGKPEYKRAVDTLRQQMREHPRTEEGGFWHKKVYPHQMWLDGLYMGSPFLAQYAAEYNEPELFDDVANQIYLIDKHTWNPETGLFYHAWDESREQHWANPQTGTSPNFWGRAIGWFAMALVDVLDYLPEDHPRRPELMKTAQKLADGILKHQDEATGVWYQVVDQGTREGNYLEASASSMYSYFLLKALNKGYLGEDYRQPAIRAFEGVVDEFVQENPDGTISLTSVCGVAGLGGDPYRSGTFEYYVNEIKRDNDPKGVAPFIMAALEYEKLQQKL